MPPPWAGGGGAGRAVASAGRGTGRTAARPAWRSTAEHRRAARRCPASGGSTIWTTRASVSAANQRSSDPRQDVTHALVATRRWATRASGRAKDRAVRRAATAPSRPRSMTTTVSGSTRRTRRFTARVSRRFAGRCPVRSGLVVRSAHNSTRAGRSAVRRRRTIRYPRRSAPCTLLMTSTRSSALGRDRCHAMSGAPAGLVPMRCRSGWPSDAEAWCTSTVVTDRTSRVASEDPTRRDERMRNLQTEGAFVPE